MPAYTVPCWVVCVQCGGVKAQDSLSGTYPFDHSPALTRAPREKLNTLEKKLRIFRDLDSSRADERVSASCS